MIVRQASWMTSLTGVTRMGQPQIPRRLASILTGRFPVNAPGDQAVLD
jgi:hypothetical protein